MANRGVRGLGAAAAALVLVVAAACGGDDAPDVAAASSTTTTTTTAPGCDRPSGLIDGRHTITSSDEPREYLLALPSEWDGDTPLPLILNFHGSGSDMDQQAAYSELPTRGAARGYAVLTPQGTGSPRGWQLGGGKDDVFVDDLLASFGDCLDAPRVFAIGISNGSAFSALTACREPYRIAAVGMVAATLGSTCPEDRQLPAIAFHGTEDRTVPYGGGAVNSRGANGLSAPGAEGAIAGWASANGCDVDPVDEQLAPDVVVRTWEGCVKPVRFHRIEGGGHTWPGAIDVRKVGITHLGATTENVSATDVFLDFVDEVGEESR